MTPLFHKLNYKAPAEIVVLRAPESFATEMDAMRAITAVWQTWPEKAHFILAFATKQEEIDILAADFLAHSEGDAVLWIAYPKSSSKRHKCTFNRDTGWTALGDAGFEPVRQVAIDEDWSALRFRKVGFIKTMTRSFALSEVGAAKATPRNTPLAPPEDLTAALAQSPAANHAFDQLAPSHRREYIRWIEEAKRAETRASRISKTVEALQNGSKQP